MPIFRPLPYHTSFSRWEQASREMRWLASIRAAAPEPTQSGIHRAAMYAATRPAIPHTEPRRIQELQKLHPI